jgi:two-component system sensor histidine kinase MtrB
MIIASRVRRLEVAREEIRREGQWRAVLMSSLAHDVRTPLTVIQGSVEMVTDDAALPAHQRKLLDTVARQVDRIARLSTTLLDVERVASGRLTLARRSVLLSDALTSVQDIAGPADLHVEVDPRLVVDADPDRLDQVMANLVDNALKHGAPPVTITAHCDDGFVTIDVRDHGRGISPTSAATLFERFGADPHTPGSIGLGLWSTRLLVEAHEGSLTYRPGNPGAIFSVRLPAGHVSSTPTRTGTSHTHEHGDEHHE